VTFFSSREAYLSLSFFFSFLQRIMSAGKLSSAPSFSGTTEIRSAKLYFLFELFPAEPHFVQVRIENCKSLILFTRPLVFLVSSYSELSSLYRSMTFGSLDSRPLKAQSPCNPVQAQLKTPQNFLRALFPPFSHLDQSQQPSSPYLALS